jgi:MFS family permease
VATSKSKRIPGRPALEATNFFMADVQAGIGPFLGVYLQSNSWQPGAIGTVMTIGGIAGMLATGPAGALVDAIRGKRALVVICSIFAVLASALILVSTQYAVVAASQIATAIAGAAIMPAIAGITLGIARQAGFDNQIGRNQVANHAGNVLGAAASGYLGWRYGFVAVFILAAVFGVLAIVSILLVPSKAIDYRAARGLSSDKVDDAASGFRVLLTCKPLLILAVSLLLFHLGNAAMLPLYGLAVVGQAKADPALFTAMTIVVAQAVMVVVSMIAMRTMRTRGHWWVLLVSFAALPVRGLLAGTFITAWGVWPVQALDGIGAGLQSVAVPALVAHLLRGTGRVNVGQGAVMTMQGIGAALSPALGGWIAQLSGYRLSFFILGAISVGSIGLWLMFHRTLREACGGGGKRRSR